jgi:hypothetical protein
MLYCLRSALEENGTPSHRIFISTVCAYENRGAMGRMGVLTKPAILHALAAAAFSGYRKSISTPPIAAAPPLVRLPTITTDDQPERRSDDVLDE